jgi:hypothetical protein
LNDSGTPLDVPLSTIIVLRTLADLVSLLDCIVVVRTLNHTWVEEATVRHEGRISPQIWPNRLYFSPSQPSSSAGQPSQWQGGVGINTKTERPAIEELPSRTEEITSEVGSSLGRTEAIIIKTEGRKEWASAKPFTGLISLHNEKGGQQDVTVLFNLALRRKYDPLFQNSPRFAYLEMELNHLFVGVSQCAPGLEPHSLQCQLRSVEISIQFDPVDSKSPDFWIFEHQYSPFRRPTSHVGIHFGPRRYPGATRLPPSEEQDHKSNQIVFSADNKFPDPVNPAASRASFWSYRVVGAPGQPTEFRTQEPHTGRIGYRIAKDPPSLVSAKITCLFEIEGVPTEVRSASGNVVELSCRHFTTCMNIEVKLWDSPDLNYFPRAIDSGGCSLTVDYPMESFPSRSQHAVSMSYIFSMLTVS